MEKELNKELEQLILWLNVNRLALNVNKTHFVIFHSVKKIVNYRVTLKIRKKAIMEKDHVMYLGVTLDTHLNWNHHILNVSKKISRSVGIMYKLKHYMNSKMLKNIYYSLIFSHIVYAIQIWGSACSTVMEKILVLQKKAVRIMSKHDDVLTFSGPLVSTNPIFKKLEILKVEDVFNFHILKFIYMCLNQSTPQNFHSWFIPNYNIHSYNTVSNTTINMRNYFEIENVETTNNIHIERGRLVNYGAKLLKVLGPNLWNSVPLKIRNAENIFLFKKNLKLYYVNKYNDI